MNRREIYGPDAGLGWAEVRGYPRTSQNGTKLRTLKQAVGNWRRLAPIETSHEFSENILNHISPDDVKGTIQRALFLDPDAPDHVPTIEAVSYRDSGRLTDDGVTTD